MDFTMVATSNVIVLKKMVMDFSSSSGFGGHVQIFGGPCIVGS
jgi:hypothetical protein